MAELTYLYSQSVYSKDSRPTVKLSRQLINMGLWSAPSDGTKLVSKIAAIQLVGWSGSWAAFCLQFVRREGNN